jgi:5'-3' exonuclease
VGEKPLDKNNDINCVDELYLDTNCLVHPVCLKTYSENKSLLQSNVERLEQLMIIEVIKYIENLVNLVNPKKLVYIAIDGVAPLAKMKQQKIRRFRSVYDHTMKENIAKKYDINYVRPWNNSAITPGTEFMIKLTNAILNYITIKKEKTINKGVKYVFNSAFTPGEGEHKIHQEIKKVIHINSVRVIYGLDADLLYLSMASEARRLFLIREITEFQDIKSDDGYCFVSVDKMKQCIFNDMTENLFMESVAIHTEFEMLHLYQKDFIQDYVFFGFMLGNDFLSSLPSVHLEYNKQFSGLNILIESYKHVFGQINDGKDKDYTFMISKNNGKVTICYEFIKSLFQILMHEEETFFQDTYKLKKPFIKNGNNYTSFNEEVINKENMQFHVPNLFQLGSKNMKHEQSKEKFYKYYNMTGNVDSIIQDYFVGLMWNGYYYLDDCVDYLWYYRHKKTPFVSDIYYWLINNEQKFNNINNIYPKFSNNSFQISPIEQLYMVLPVQTSFLLPKQCKTHMLNDELHFPLTIDLDLQCISKLWQANPTNITMHNHLHVKNIIGKMNLTLHEQNRNRFMFPYETII